MSLPNILTNNEVTLFLDNLNHPFRSEIEYLRNCILASNSELIENIKWNGPNYSFRGEDRITMRVQPLKKQVQLIFHRGAKKMMQPDSKLIQSDAKWLVWKENDRAVATFKSKQELEDAEFELTQVIIKWVKSTM
jgi:hypothetical protein